MLMLTSRYVTMYISSYQLCTLLLLLLLQAREDVSHVPLRLAHLFFQELRELLRHDYG